MDSKVILCVFLTLFFLTCCVCGKNRNVKGLYCKDPDTGVLHTINSTWRSTTFCGNYTCKMRKTNKTINTETNISTFDNNKLTTLQLKQAEYNTNAQRKKTMNISSNDIYVHNRPKDKEADRYLTRNEIQEIAEILQNVKKSDFEALLELYSAAKELYNEIDKDDGKNPPSIKELMEKSQGSPQKSESTYWYDPHYNLKKMKALDLKTDESNIYRVHKNIKAIEPIYYFNGGLSTGDFRKLPYFYPISAFQRYSSYMHDPKAAQHPNGYIEQPLPSVAPIIYTATPPRYSTVPKSYAPAAAAPVPSCKHHYYDQQINPDLPHTAIHENPAKESTISALERSTNLLPFPFTNMQRVNELKFQMPFFRVNPWMEFLPTKDHLRTTQPRASGPIGFGKFTPIDGVAPTFINTEIEGNPDVAIEEVMPMKKKVHTKSIEENVIPKSRNNQKSLPDWKTEDLPKEVIEEIRANVLEKSNNLLLTPFPLKKSKIKIENLGRLLKKPSRKKRDANETLHDIKANETEKIYEAYIEKTVCKADYGLGYFSVGNSSQPYPSCCPQRIEPTTTDTPATTIIN